MAQVADEIFRIFALKENENLSNEEKKQMISKIVLKVYENGKYYGSKKAIKLCKDSLTNVENTIENFI